MLTFYLKAQIPFFINCGLFIENNNNNKNICFKVCCDVSCVFSPNVVNSYI